MNWLRIFKRNEWGAKYGTGWGTRPLPAPEAWLHHSVTAAPPVNATFEQDAAAVRALDQIGYDRFKSADTGYTRPEGAGISYTWAVAPSGRVFEGHDPKRNSSHTAGHNGSGVGIVLIGNYETAKPTLKQIEAVARLLLQARDDKIIKTAALNGGHKDVYATACPGKNAYDYIPEINRMVKSIEAGGNKEMPVDPNKGFTTDYIKEVQTVLKTLGYYSGAITGSLPDVDEAVRAFQGANNLTVDGQPGNNTMTVARVRLSEYEARIAKEKAEAEAAAAAAAAREKAIEDMRISGSNRWATAKAVALATLPTGPGVLIAADSTPDITLAVTRASADVRVLPVRAGSLTPPTATVEAVKALKPKWIRFVGGDDVVTKNCARILADLL